MAEAYQNHLGWRHCPSQTWKPPPAHWRLGRITEVHPDSDGLIRNATLITSYGVSTQAVQKLCLLLQFEISNQWFLPADCWRFIFYFLFNITRCTLCKVFLYFLSFHTSVICSNYCTIRVRRSSSLDRRNKQTCYSAFCYTHTIIESFTYLFYYYIWISIIYLTHWPIFSVKSQL